MPAYESTNLVSADEPGPHRRPRPSWYRGRGSVLETCERVFGLLVTGPSPLAIHPRHFSDLPDRSLPLHQLRVLLASPAVSPRTRAAIWCYLVRRARTRGRQQAAWTVGCAGLALPELVRIVAALARRYGGDVADLEAAVLGGFLAELRRVDLDDSRDRRIRRRLLMAAYRAARALRDTTHQPDPDSQPVGGSGVAPEPGQGPDRTTYPAGHGNGEHQESGR